MTITTSGSTLTFSDSTTQTTAGVTSITAGTGISSSGGLTPTITNTGVTSVTASTGISVSASTGGVTITNTAPMSGGTCVAWVNYKGTSTQGIRASYNVSSVTYVSTGNYTVNFTNALTDANYSALATCNFEEDIGLPANTKTFATTSIQVSAFRPYPYDTYYDVTYMSVAVFR